MHRSSTKAIVGFTIAAAALAPAAIAGACGEEDPHLSAPSSAVGGALAPSAFGVFYGYPQLGDEPVRGSGCGGDGSIGDTIPDGTWAGYVERVWDGSPEFPIDIDLACVYFGESARQVRSQGEQNILNDDPNFPVVNNNERTRSVNGDAGSSVSAGGWLTPDTCEVGPGWPVADASSRLAWIDVANGELLAIYFSCA